MRIPNVDLLGVSASIPGKLVDNRDSLIELYGDKSENVIKTTVVESRAIAPRGVTSLDLNCHAAAGIIEATDTNPIDIAGVVNVTFTPSFRLPGDASGVQERLGLRNKVIALDINMACSGFPHGATVAAQLASSLQAPILLTVGDVQSPFVSKFDKSTFPLMADVGTASLVTPASGVRPWILDHYSDGSGVGSLFIPAGGTRFPLEAHHLDFEESTDGSRRRKVDIYMNGFDVFRFVAKDVADFLSSFLRANDIRPDDLGAFVPHQPNLFMIDQLARKLGIPHEIVWRSAHKYGNPASASIPLTLAFEGTSRGRLSGPTATLLAGFGAGLSVGAIALDISPSTIFQILQYPE